MKSEKMTELQRQSLEHFEKARSEGLSIKAYAGAHGIPAQRIYDAVGRLRRRGALKGPVVGERAKFMKVKIVARPASPSSVESAVCRMRIPSGLVIDCLLWPPRSWLIEIGKVDAET
jgi:hypothetical protein